MPVIDVHNHFVTPVVMDLADNGAMGLHREGDFLIHPDGYWMPMTPCYVDSDAKVAEMDEMGIDIAALSITPTLIFYDAPADEFGEFARTVNDSLAETIKAEDRLYGFAMLPLQAPEEAAAELERTVKEYGFVGAEINTSFEQYTRPLDATNLDPVFEVAERLDVPLLLHADSDRLDPLLQQSYYLTVTVGIPLDTTLAAARLMSSGTFDRFPRLKIILTHGGGFLPYQLGRIEHAFMVRPELKEKISSPPSAYLDRFWMDTITHGDEALTFLTSLIGIERVVVGTDASFDMGDSRPLERLKRTGLDPETLGANAAELLGIRK